MVPVIAPPPRTPARLARRMVPIQHAFCASHEDEVSQIAVQAGHSGHVQWCCTVCRTQELLVEATEDLEYIAFLRRRIIMMQEAQSAMSTQIVTLEDIINDRDNEIFDLRAMLQDQHTLIQTLMTEASEEQTSAGSATEPAAEPEVTPTQAPQQVVMSGDEL